MKGGCATMPDDSAGAGVTKYSIKVWDVGTDEPSGWVYRISQASSPALGLGGCAVVAHELDVTFGDISIVDLSSSGLDEK
jgi:hypothetical protein